MKNRKIALCVASWGSEETVRCWVWLKKYVLQAANQGSSVDELYILHVKQRGDRSGHRWDSGGPLLPDVKTAATGFKLRVEELEGTPGSAIVEYVNKEDIDFVVMGSKGRNNIRRTVMGSTTEYVLRRVRCACLILRPKVGVGDSYRLKSAQPSTHVGSPKSQPSSPLVEAPVLSAGLAHIKSAGRNLSVRLGVGPPGGRQKLPDPTAVGAADARRVAIVLDNMEHGRAILHWAAQVLLRPSDTVFVVQWKAWSLTSQLRAEQLSAGSPELAAVVAEALPGEQPVLSHQLQGDKSSIVSFVAKEAIDILVIGRCRTRGQRKALAGRRISSYLYHVSGCPSLLIPLGPAAAADDDSDSDADSGDDNPPARSSDDELGPLPGPTYPRRSRSLSPGRPELPSRGRMHPTALVSSLQADLQRHATESHTALKGFKELLVHLDDTGNIHSISPVVRHQVVTPIHSPGGGTAGDRPLTPSTPREAPREPPSPSTAPASNAFSSIFKRSSSPFSAASRASKAAARASAAATAAGDAPSSAPSSAPPSPPPPAAAGADASADILFDAPLHTTTSAEAIPSSASSLGKALSAAGSLGQAPSGTPSLGHAGSDAAALPAVAGAAGGPAPPAVDAEAAALAGAGSGGEAAAAVAAAESAGQVQGLKQQLQAKDDEIAELRRLLLQLQPAPAGQAVTGAAAL